MKCVIRYSVHNYNDCSSIITCRTECFDVKMIIYIAASVQLGQAAVDMA